MTEFWFFVAPLDSDARDDAELYGWSDHKDGNADWEDKRHMVGGRAAGRFPYRTPLHGPWGDKRRVKW